MQRLAGQDAIFLYRETSTSLMHTLKVHIIKVSDPDASYAALYEKLAAQLNANPMLRKRIMPVPFGFHHPVMVDDPDFDVSAHIFRAAIPAPGSMRELDDMVAQIGSTLLDRSRPLWEMWVLHGLESGQVAVVHKIHHSMADGLAYVGFVSEGWDEANETFEVPDQAPPLPGPFRLMYDASLDHLRHDIKNLWPIMKSFVGNLREIAARNKAANEPRINPLTAQFPRTRFNYALGVKRSFATQQISLEQIKQLKDRLGVTLNDVVLAVVAGALRNYLLEHDELPSAPLALAIPVGADKPGSTRQWGNRVTTLFSMLHTEMEDPLERLYAIKKQTEQGKEDLEIFGKHQWGDLMQYVPPALMTWSCKRNFRLKPANKQDFRPNSNIVISNVPGPRQKLGNADGELEAIYSVGVLGEGMGLNITVWSYQNQLNFAALACRKAVPDTDRLMALIPVAIEELQQAADNANRLGNVPNLRPQPHAEKASD